MPKDVNAGVLLPAGEVEGVDANCFRVLPNPGGGYFLDFCAYDKAEECAIVVRRLRLKSGLLKALAESLGDQDDIIQLDVRFGDLRGSV